MKNMKYILGLMFAMPFCAWASGGNETGIGTTQVPFGRIYDAVKSFPDLYETNFVKLLENKTTYTLHDVAQACVNFIAHSNGKVEKCQDFVRSVIGRSNSIASTTVEDFVVTTTVNTNKFEFDINASGKFYVDCGAGGDVQEITKPDMDSHTVICDYSGKSGQYKIKITGRATGYPNCTERDIECSAISFWHNTNLYSIQGSLGSVFPTLPNGVQPRFNGTFGGCENLTGSIPSNLFAGIRGQPVAHMFDRTFSGCFGLTSIPEGLFAGISGAPAEYMFDSTFHGCSGLTSIPKGLFAGISGAPAEGMFYATFDGCSRLTSIPDRLFAGISGAPAEGMFDSTFDGCSGLTSIPEGLFAGISGAPAEWMFSSTFNNCSRLTSIPDGLFAGISGAPAKGMFDSTFDGCSRLTSIPDRLFADISGAPAEGMFSFTFDGCSGLTSIPKGLFAGISGAPAEGMFFATFNGCSGLTSIPDGLFAGISGEPADEMFGYTFYGCINLSGTSAKIGDQYLYQIWPEATTWQVEKMYSGCTNLDDYSDIPDLWK